jgi:F-type H+-transporting ATPase subunit a
MGAVEEEGEMKRAEPSDAGFLRRLRRATLFTGALVILILSTYVGLAAGGAALLGLLLSLVNLSLLERVFAQVLIPGERRMKRFILLLLCKLPLLLAGVYVALALLRLPPVWFLLGFGLVLIVTLLKSLGWLLTSSRERASGAGRRGLWLSGVGLLLSSPVLLYAFRALAEEKKDEGAPELPSAISILKDLFPGRGWAEALARWENPIYSTLVILLLCVVAVAAYRQRTLIPGKLQNVVELFVETFSNFILGILGPRGKEFIPFLGTLFFYIWLNNLQGLIPFFKSPTSVYNTTLALAICVFGYVQFTGMTQLGIKGYLHHMLGSPHDVIGWCMVPLMLPLHLIEEVAKPVSLSLRLFGNIMGEDVLLGVFVTLGIALLSFTKMPVGLPLHLPFIFLALLTSTIQALVFTILATIYFSQMMPHEEEHEAH